MFSCFGWVKVTEWPPVGKMAAHSACEVFSWYQCLVVGLFYPASVFGVGIFFMTAPFPDLCLRVPFNQPNVANFKVMAPKRRTKMIKMRRNVAFSCDVIGVIPIQTLHQVVRTFS